VCVWDLKPYPGAWWLCLVPVDGGSWVLDALGATLNPKPYPGAWWLCLKPVDGGRLVLDALGATLNPTLGRGGCVLCQWMGGGWFWMLWVQP
jgi:hypothetical protein